MPVDLLQVLPDFDTAPFSHLLPSLDRALITTADLVSLEPADLARRATVPAAELLKLRDAVVGALHQNLGCGAEEQQHQSPSAFLSAIGSTAASEHDKCGSISTLDSVLDAAFGGGISAGYLVEVTGESGAGKTQLLLTLLLAVQLPRPHGLAKSAIYISTEAPLATKRLLQLLSAHPSLSSLPLADRPSLSRILSIKTDDLESQEHILRYQLPVAIKRNNVGLVVIDSIAANYRAEFEKKGPREGAASMAKRGAQLVQLGALLRDLARTEGIAIVVANQVADRFTRHSAPASSIPAANAASRTPSANSQNVDRTATPQDPSNQHPRRSATLSISPDPLTLDHQQRWFTGWGDDRFVSSQSLKTPSLGLVWTNQIACRIALIKRPVYKTQPLMPNVDGQDEWNEERESHIDRWQRWCKVVFCPWAPPTAGEGVEFGLVGEGIRHVEHKK